LFASAYLYYSNPTTSSTTNYLPISNSTKTITKSMDDGKEVYANFCIQCHQANGKGDGINFPP
jgi:cytochrome c